MKLMIGVCGVLVILCGALGYFLKKATEELNTKEIQVSQLEATIERNAQDVKVTDRILERLERENNDFRQERAARDESLRNKLVSPGGKAWGDSEIPEDIRQHLLDLERKK